VDDVLQALEQQVAMYRQGESHYSNHSNDVTRGA
jgi:hypothetical protein